MYLITVEGGDGSGKGEAVRILTELLAYYCLLYTSDAADD